MAYDFHEPTLDDEIAGLINMLSFRIRGFYLLCVYGQLLIVNAVFWAWIALHQWLGQVEFSSAFPLSYLVYSELLSVGVLFTAMIGHSRLEFVNPDLPTANRLALRQVVVGLFCLLIYLVGVKDANISRLFLFTFLPVHYVTSLLCHYYLPISIRRWSFTGTREERILVAGHRENIAGLLPWLQQKATVGCRTVGMICPQEAMSPAPLPVLGEFNALEQVLLDHQITQLIVASVELRSTWIVAAADICERKGVRFLLVDEWRQLLARPVTHFEDEGVRFVGLRNEPLEDPFNRVAKRILDILIALPVTVFILPPMHCVVWLLQRGQSPGPVYHLQPRAGIQNRMFTMVKYRTMHVQAFDEAKQATRYDDRVFPAGRWLRKFSLDELPQFYNVLRGEMSVVGPRPHLVKHNHLFAQAIRNYHIRAAVKPGITGLAQVTGLRGGTSTTEEIAARVKADIDYLEHWSFSMDCWIIVRTIRHVVLPPDTAY